MKKVNIEEMTLKLNQFRDQNVGKTLTSQELGESLYNLGFSKTVSSAIAQKCFAYELIGKDRSRLYEVPKEPIHKSILVGIYKRMNDYNAKRRDSSPKPAVAVKDNSKVEQQQAWDTLVKAGVIKPKFNLTILKTKYPKVYLDCLEYEIVVNK